MNNLRRATIVNAINNPHINLYKGEGYWYFVYDDGCVYRDRSVYVYRLNELTLEQWCDHADELLWLVNTKYEL